MVDVAAPDHDRFQFQSIPSHMFFTTSSAMITRFYMRSVCAGSRNRKKSLNQRSVDSQRKRAISSMQLRIFYYWCYKKVDYIQVFILQFRRYKAPEASGKRDKNGMVKFSRNHFPMDINIVTGEFGQTYASKKRYRGDFISLNGFVMF